MWQNVCMGELGETGVRPWGRYLVLADEPEIEHTSDDTLVFVEVQHGEYLVLVALMLDGCLTSNHLVSQQQLLSLATEIVSRWPTFTLAEHPWLWL